MNNASAVESLLFAALEKSTAAERAAFLDSACGGDADLRGQVEKLLKANADAGDFLQKPAVEQLAEESSGATQALDLATDHKGATVTQSASDDDNSDLGFLQPSTRPDSLGRLGHYEVLQVLGRGGFGIVFRAFDEVLQRVVALKALAPAIAATSPARKRFLREARSSAQVRHENVVHIYEVGEQPLPYLVMEFVPGETLEQKLDRCGPFDVPETLRIGRQIAEGLAAAHATDLIHRDIKPANVLLEGGHHKVKITDFGLARAADDASISQSGIIAGTPTYMAPEQALGQTLDQRADLFSLGSVLYQMVAGRPPFRANTTVAVLKRVAEDRPRAIREIIPETPQWLCDIIAKLHAKDPADRYQSAREVADVLADCEAQLKANAKLKDFSRIPQSKRVAGRPEAQAAWRKPAGFAAAALLLPVVALALTEIAGITHLLPKQQPIGDRPKNGGGELVQPKPPQDNESPADFTNTLGMKFKLIPAGKFTMGSPKEEIDRCLKQLEGAELWVKKTLATEGPEHLVEITQPFYLGATEVTVGQFRQFVDEQGYQVGDGRWRNPGFDQTDQHPVVWVSWHNAVDFCKWLSKKEGKEYRLPTEAEWEYSCRAGKAGSRYCFGDDDAKLEEYAWYATDSGVGQHPGAGTHAVGKKKPNAWGLYGMHGNAWEWCQDNYDPDYYKSSPVKDPLGPSAGGGRVARGGSWPYGPVYSRSAFRGYIAPNFRGGWGGFRVLLVSPPAGVGTESGAKDEKVAAEKQDPDRRAAEYVLTHGGAVKVNGQDQEIKAADVPGKAFRLTGVVLWNADGNQVSVTEAGLAVVKDCKEVTEIKTFRTRLTDAGLAHFQNCKNLTFIGMEAPGAVTDEGLAAFKDCKNLRFLRLTRVPLTGAGLVHFKDCKNLGSVHLYGTQVSDAGLMHLKDCKNLTDLSLLGTPVSDAGLGHLAGLDALTDLDLRKTQVTAIGVLELGKALPKCKITWNGGVIGPLQKRDRP